MPVDIITARQIEVTGASETMAVIQRLAPSFNFPRTTIADGSASVRPASLRGLGPDQVLVLINGKRRHTTALVHVNGTMGRGSTGADLNAIPVSAIERIEILRDGAAAQYGSDAIAGVINIVLKSGVAPGRLDVKGGTTATDQGVGEDTTWDGGNSTAGSTRDSTWAAAGPSSPANTATGTAPTARAPIPGTRSCPATRAGTWWPSPTTGSAIRRPWTT